jgi:hypothetical protein
MTDITLKKKALDLLQKGKLDSALRVFQAILKDDPEDASVHNSAGDVLLKLKRKDEALGHFTAASELYLKDGLHMVAISVSRKALRTEPTYPPAHYLMAACFDEQSKPDQARREYVAFLKGSPDKNDPLVLNALTALTRLDPEDRNWVLRLARVAFVQKKESILDRCVSMSAERGFPEHRKMVNMLEELRQELRPQPVEEEIQIEQVSFDSGDFIEAEAIEEPEEVEQRKRIGEYFVADGLLKASDVLRALEIQNSSRDHKRLGDVFVDMGLVSIRLV